MNGFESYLAILLGFIVVTSAPGPANVAVATIAMGSGRKQALVFALGLAVGLSFWGIVAATGLGAVLEQAGQFLIALKLFGGAYMLWLAFQSARTAFGTRKAVVKPISGRRWFMRGVLLNLSNPKSVLAWMTALSMGLGSQSTSSELAIATLLCMAFGFANFLGYALAFRFQVLQLSIAEFAAG
ncbi:MAG: LysE family translocator [Pseudoruegeria sp.]